MSIPFCGRAMRGMATALFAAGALAACGTSDTAPAPDASPPVTSVHMPAVTLSPGQETTQCVVLELPNATPQMLRRARSVISIGSHHLIAYRVPAGSPLQPVPQPCQPFSDITNGVSPVVIAESPDVEVVYPDNVGLPIEAHQLIKLEEHFINGGDEAVQATGRVDFTLSDPDPSLKIADLLFWGPQQFTIVPHSAGSADFAHTVNAGVNVFAMTTHEHHYGTLATISLDAAGAQPSELYRNTDWEHPPLKSFSPAMPFDGSQSLQLHCEWFNTSDVEVPFGLSAVSNEMCFFWAYYYPSQGFQVCNEDGCQMQ